MSTQPVQSYAGTIPARLDAAETRLAALESGTP